MIERLVVADSSPLIALASIDRLSLLPKLYETVLVPPAVWEEVVERPGRPGADAVRAAAWVRREALRDAAVAQRMMDAGLGPGESEVIALALEVGAESALIDERRARKHADRVGLRTRGVLGVLAVAARRGFVAHVELPKLFDRLASGGFRFTPKERDAALRMAGSPGV